MSHAQVISGRKRMAERKEFCQLGRDLNRGNPHSVAFGDADGDGV